MALRYIGEAGKSFSVTVGKNHRTIVEPVPGEVYLIDDPEDGNWEPEFKEDSKVAKADKGPVAPDVTKSAENGTTEAVEGE
jgi:hypothetical protein